MGYIKEYKIDRLNKAHIEFLGRFLDPIITTGATNRFHRFYLIKT